MKTTAKITVVLGAIMLVGACPARADLVFDSGYNTFDANDPYYDEVWVINNAHLDVLGGAMGKLELNDFATSNIYSGDIDLLALNHNTVVNIYSSDMDFLAIQDSTVVNIHGGTLDCFAAAESSLVYLYAYDVTYHPTGGLENDGWIEGTYLSNDRPFSFSFYNHTTYSHLIVVPKPPTIYYVNAAEGSDDNDGLSPGTPFATIQKAIDSALDGDTVLVADGTYTGPGNRDIDFLGKAITVRSESGPKNCIIDCETLGRGFYFHNGEDANSVLDGFTITNGYARQGGGIYCRESSPTITNCIISGNTCEREWGASGGGVGCENGNLTISNCVISENISGGYWGGASGGGISCYGSEDTTLTITNCIISSNTSNAGGGICCGGNLDGQGGTFTITNCIIMGNSVEGKYDSYGGGIYCGGEGTRYGTGGIFNITNCIISGNLAKRSKEYPSYGGGIYCEDDNIFRIANCLIAENSASIGGGIHFVYSNPTIANCTFAGNSAPNGNALACDYWRLLHPSNVQMTNSILADGGNEIYNNDGSTITITYSNVQGSWPGEGNINADPYFVEPGYWADANDPNIVVEPNDPNAIWIEGDYYLLPDSLCIDTGDPNYIPEPNETDLDGNPRVINGRIDMGAYETNYIQAAMKLTPQMLNCNSKGKYVKAHLTLPEGFLPQDVDVNAPAIAEPMGIESEYIKVLGAGPVRLEICFDREAFCAQITETGEIEITVIGSLTTSRYFYATDTIRIKP